MHRFLVLLGLLFTVQGVVLQAYAQDLIDMYQSARLEAQAAEMARTHGMQLEPLAVERIPAPHDSLFVTEQEPVAVVEAKSVEEPPNPYAGAEWRIVRRLMRGGFEREFANIRWAYMGSSEWSPLDTTMTRELRARLQARFGNPTRTILEVMRDEGQRIDEYLQFEYWFVLNDSIPVIAMDAAGPFDRGLVIASDERYRRQLSDIRSALGAELLKEAEPAVYSDYYYDSEQRTWYLTGFDGRRYYTQRVTQPDFARFRQSLADQ